VPTSLGGKREEGRGKREEGRGKREEGRGKREEGRGKREEGRGTTYIDFTVALFKHRLYCRRSV